MKYLHEGDTRKAIDLVLDGKLRSFERWIARIQRTQPRRALVLSFVLLDLVDDIYHAERDGSQRLN